MSRGCHVIMLKQVFDYGQAPFGLLLANWITWRVVSSLMAGQQIAQISNRIHVGSYTGWQDFIAARLRQEIITLLCQTLSVVSLIPQDRLQDPPG